jgi:hypothetical protein
LPVAPLRRIGSRHRFFVVGRRPRSLARSPWRAIRLPPCPSLGELGSMRSPPRLPTAFTLAALIALACPAAAAPVDVGPLARLAREAGLRLLGGRHLTLATDRPVREGDGVAELPAVFDEAFVAWCRHYGMDPADHADWRCFGCLVIDRERFRAAGLLPAEIPPFENGFCDRNRFWLMDQSNPAYRRHLLLHEGVHAFTLTLRELATPVWYNEGIAEYLATHRLDREVNGSLRFVSTPMPAQPDDVEQLGRVEKLLELRAERRLPALGTVLALPIGQHGAIADYAASWAAVALLANHPAYARGFAALERGPLGPDFSARLAALPGWDSARAARDYAAFTTEVDYGWDFSRMAIDWSPGVPLTRLVTLPVDASQGWQNTGVAAAAGRRYAFTGTGRVGLGTVTDATTGIVTQLESEADGISLEWYRGQPTGRLLIGQWVERPAEGEPPRFEVLASGAQGELTAVANGPLYLRLNGPPGRLAERDGTVSVKLEPLP